ncbi:hypothetical protein ACJJIQ_05125 [Microbulbifer sp. ANSA003]|uniref:hypothetical protein n=1 Tax=Microbulbifer sp. ANSA003 TaxID=3243360 RepID=UPI004042FD26
MSKIMVNESEFIDAINEELQNHPSYEEGMKVFGVPEGGTRLSGYDWSGPDSMFGVLAQVVAEVNKKYELEVS